MCSSNHFSISSRFPCFSRSRFFRVQVFQCPGFQGPGFQGPGPGSRVQDPGPGSRSRVPVQVQSPDPGPGSGSGSRVWVQVIEGAQISSSAHHEILHNMCIAIVCQPGCNVINFEINSVFLIKPFFYMTKKSRQKYKYFENEKSCQDEIKSIFHCF